MRILLVNKFHYYRGGSEKYYFELGKLLIEKGHKVAFFSMKDKQNIKTGEEEYFVDNLDGNSKNVSKMFQIIYSNANYTKMNEALEKFKPDIVHINNFQRQLSASIVSSVKAKNIPMVLTAHDFQPVCPASVMLTKNGICEECNYGNYKNCISNKCMKGSLLKSTLGYFEAKYYHKNNIYDNFNCIIAPSNFVKNKFVAKGLKYQDIKVLHNFLDESTPENTNIQKGDFAFFSGRLTVEKGVSNLITAFTKIKNGNLVIAGDGPEKANLQNIINKNNLQNRVKLLGYLDQTSLKEYLRKCSFVIVPSIWYENCPYSILESLSMGKAVIGSNIGGIPELINNKNGLLYNYDDVTDLSKKIDFLFKNPACSELLGKGARSEFTLKYTKDVYYEKLIDIYNEVKLKKDKVKY